MILLRTNHKLSKAHKIFLSMIIRFHRQRSIHKMFQNQIKKSRLNHLILPKISNSMIKLQTLPKRKRNQDHTNKTLLSKKLTRQICHNDQAYWTQNCGIGKVWFKFQQLRRYLSCLKKWPTSKLITILKTFYQ